jgi:hypothetical protein
MDVASYSNGDDVFLVWRFDEDPTCLGVAIHRTLTIAAGETTTGFLRNGVGFADDAAAPAADNNQPAPEFPSDQFPFQRYTWTDHGVSEGDTVTYELTKVALAADGTTALDRAADATAAVGPIQVTSAASNTITAVFNRGILLSQFIARQLPKDFTKHDLLQLKASLEADDSELRAFLTGQLGRRLLSLLDEAKADKLSVWAALYELSDDVLIDRLAAFGAKAHVVLSNGSDKQGDGNAASAGKLTGTDLHRRLLGNEGLGHNKFLVIGRTQSEVSAVWTGSTNWAPTGLCTQMNNGILIEDEALAAEYLAQWKRLRDDVPVPVNGKPRHFGPKLMAANDEPKTGALDGARRELWFTRTSAHQDLDAATERINAAHDGILFLMFEPGSTGLLQTVQARLSPASPTFDEHMYVQGVVNTLKKAGAGTDVSVDLVGRGQNTSFDLRVVEPEGVTNLAGWVDEVTRDEFLTPQGAIGHAIIHSKVMVIDPFTDPVVITGSHNFSASASKNNDENLLIVSGHAALAERYAVNIMATYQHYRFRQYVKDQRAAGRSPFHGLRKDAKWQHKQIAHDRELQFWLRSGDG